MEIDIKALRRLEDDLKAGKISATTSVERDAMVNLLKYLQIETVHQFETAYDRLCFELDKDGGLACLRSIAPIQSADRQQPKVCLELQDGDKEAQLARQVDFYLQDARLAKSGLDELVKDVANEVEGCEAKCVEVKSSESTTRKAKSSYGGNVRMLSDMARVSVICDKPEDLARAFSSILGRLQPHEVRRVTNGFTSDWMPSGYRDVKVNPAVNEHVCEIQLQLRQFYELKHDQHAVYEWARELSVTAKMEAEQLFENLSGEVTEEMIRLAEGNWRGTGYCLVDLLTMAGQYAKAEEGSRKVSHLDVKDWREALLQESTARRNLGYALKMQAKFQKSHLVITGPIFGCELFVFGVLKFRSITDTAVQGKHAEAEPLYERSQAIREKVLGPKHPDVAEVLNNRATLLKSQGIREEVLGTHHPAVATALNNRAGLLSVLAETLYASALEIWEKVLGPEHPNVATANSNRAAVLGHQGSYAEAARLFERSQIIHEKVLGPEHPKVATDMNNRAVMLKKQAIREKSLGPEHPDVAQSLSNRAGLLRSLVRNK
ncbi:unnamed protein product [Ectocarpus sp. CCAP 1310/34]|nr:unnamed protein product [Ectocarpus sp. CCAP 1310/34]